MGILTVVPGLTMDVFINHGNAKPIKTSKTLLPSVFDTAMSPEPKNCTKYIFVIVCGRE